MFVLSHNGFSVQADGIHRRLAAATADDADDAASQLLCSGERGVPELMVGLLPFAGDATPFLYQPRHARWGEGLASPWDSALVETACDARADWWVRDITPRPSAASYAASVTDALSHIDKGGDEALQKVVLARALDISFAEPVDTHMLAARLAGDPSIATFLVDLAPLSGVNGHSFIGATPELLVSRRGWRIFSHPLAGSAPRLPSAADDREAGEALLASEKDRREHGLVVEAILDLLAPYCSRLSAPDGMELRSTDTMWHLGTNIEGELKGHAMPSATALAALLHPTPAVGGYPREPALRLIGELEGRDRGFYAGAVGWTAASGDGDWYVALRCAEIRARHMTLHAGAGIVAGSDPDAELRETAAKFRAMLQALGIDEAELMEVSR